MQHSRGVTLHFRALLRIQKFALVGEAAVRLGLVCCFALAWCAAVSPASLTLDRLQACYAIVITCATLTATYSSAKMLVQARISCLPQRATGLRVSLV